MRRLCLSLLVAILFVANASADVRSGADPFDRLSVSVDSVAMYDSIYFALVNRVADVLGVAPDAVVYMQTDSAERYLAVEYTYKEQKKKKINTYMGLALLAGNTLAPVWKKEEVNPNVMLACTPVGLLMCTPNGDTNMINYVSGKDMWSKKFPFLPCYVTDKTIIGYPNANQKKLFAFDLMSGEKIWTTSVAHEGGWSAMQMIDDDNMFIVADDLYRINLTSGETRRLKCKPAILDGKRMAATIAIGIATGVATGVASGGAYFSYYLPSGNGDRSINTCHTLCAVPSDGLHISGLCSNILTIGELNYFSDRERMRCFDYDMNVIWETDLPDDHSSLAKLIDRDDTILMVNFGRGLRPGRGVYASGTPYVASYRKSDGELLSYNTIAEEKECVLEYMSDEYGIYMVSERHVFYLPYDGELEMRVRE